MKRIKNSRGLERFSWYCLGAVSATVPYAFHGWTQAAVLVAVISIGSAALRYLWP